MTIDNGFRRDPMRVFITVDTEIWPRHNNWREDRLARDYQRDISGITPEGDFGIPYQLRVLNSFGLKAVFFVEALHAREVGDEQLRRLVWSIQAAGQEVQLHLHTEWLKWMSNPLLPGRTGQNIRQFTQEEQVQLIAEGVANLSRAGSHNICAFRAGNYGANSDTLRALARNGISYDCSYNLPYLTSTCGLKTPEVMLQPRLFIDGVYEVPVSYFQHPPGMIRHAQLCACSAGELERALEMAWQQHWPAFVIVSHGFEFLKDRKQTERPPRPDWTVIRRFERLCRFLALNRNRFETVGFTGLNLSALGSNGSVGPIRLPAWLAAARMLEQAFERVS